MVKIKKNFKMLTKVAIVNNNNNNNKTSNIMSNSVDFSGSIKSALSSKTVKSNGPSICSNSLLTSSTSSSGINPNTSNNQQMNSSNPTTEEENEKKIISEFVHLLEKSKQLFNGLR